MKTDSLRDKISTTLLPALLNSYSVIFFFNNRFFSIVLLIVTFFNPVAGASGLIAALSAVLIADRMGFDKVMLRQGIYSFNALLAGIGFGTMYDPGLVFLALLLLLTLISLLISVVLGGLLSRTGLPFLSIPFVLSLWIVMLPSGHLANIGLSQRNVFWINEMYSFGGKQLVDIFQVIDNLPLNKTIVIYLRALSSIIFQDNLLTGMLIAAALLVTSRITFSLSVLGFFTAWLFAYFIGSDMASFTFYNIGANYILLAIAIGGFFLIPSGYSFLWAVILIPVLSMFILFFRSLGFSGLPLFSLPFSLVSIAFIYFLKLRTEQGHLKCTVIQHYLPEVNLYTFINNSDRLTGYSFFPLQLPFWGEWSVYQGYDGEYTHKGDWKDAVDFVIRDEKGSLFSDSAFRNESYYCFDKPVLAPADGFVTEVVGNVLDNEPGRVNTAQNWGNTVIIKHADHLYTKLSHLRQGSVRKKKGDYVTRGEIVASCGNSGRSPESHLHFQVQSAPSIGSKTLAYPFAYYLERSNDRYLLRSFTVPSLDQKVMNVTPDNLLTGAFDLEPGMTLGFNYWIADGPEKNAKWEIITDAYNNKYVYCSESQSFAYFVNDGTMFYFTAYYGSQKSLLFYFYITFFKVLMGYYPDIEITDRFPLHIIKKSAAALWIHDLVAPFHQFLEMSYRNRTSWSDSVLNPEKLQLNVNIDSKIFGKARMIGSGSALIAGRRISEFNIDYLGRKIWAKRTDI